MNKKEIQKIYNKKIKKINEYNKLYYNESNPGISDSDYDKLTLFYDEFSCLWQGL